MPATVGQRAEWECQVHLHCHVLAEEARVYGQLPSELHWLFLRAPQVHNGTSVLHGRTPSAIGASSTHLALGAKPCKHHSRAQV